MIRASLNSGTNNLSGIKNLLDRLLTVGGI